MVGIQELVVLERGHLVSVKLALLQGSQYLAPAFFDVLTRKGRMVQAIGQDIQDIVQILHQALGRKGRGMIAAVDAQRRAQRLDLFPDLGKGAAFRSPCHHRGRQPGQTRLIWLLVNASDPKPPMDNDGRATRVLPRKACHTIGKSTLGDGFRPRQSRNIQI